MPDLIEQIISRALSREPGSAARSFLLKRERELERRMDRRADLLAQPDLLERRVAAHAGAFSLSTRRLRTRRWQSKVDALEEQAGGTPQEGFASELLGEYTAALQDPNYLGLSERQLLGAVSKDLMLRPDEEGKTRLEKAYRHKWRADTSLGNLFGVFGEDKDVRALPGYEQYLEAQKAKPVDEWHTGPLEAAAIGGGFTAALMAGSKILGRAAMLTPAPGARIVGGALMAIPEFMAFDAIHNVIAKTEWGRAREGTWRKIGADLLAGGVVIGGGYKVATTALRKAAEKSILSKTATDILMKHPTAKRAIEAGEAQRVARIEQERANQAIIKNIGRDDVLTEVANMSAVLERIKIAKVGEAAEVRMARELAKPRIPRPGVTPIATAVVRGPQMRIVPTSEAKAGKELVDSILTASGQPRFAGELDIGKVFAKELTEEGADRALKKTRTKGARTAITEEKRIVELEKEVAKREDTYIKVLEKREGELEDAYIARLEERELALEKKLATRAEQRTKLKKVKEVQKDVAEDIAKEKPVTAEFVGWQEDVAGRPPVALYNIIGGPRHESIVSAKTLVAEGIGVPEAAKVIPGRVMTKEVTDLSSVRVIKAVDEIRGVLTGGPLPKMPGVTAKGFSKHPEYSWNIVHSEAAWSAHEAGVLEKAAEYVLIKKPPVGWAADTTKRVRRLAAKVLGYEPPIEPKGYPGKIMTKEEVKAKLLARGEKPALEVVDEEFKAAENAINKDINRTVSIAEEPGLEELLYGGGAEEPFVEGVKRGGKDLVDLINDSGKLFGIVGLFGSVTLASLFEPDSAEASVLVKTGATVAKTIARTARKAKTKLDMIKLAKDWKSADLIHIPAAEGAKEKLSFQEVIRTAPMAIEEHGSLVKNIKAEATPWSLVRVMSPYTSGEILYKVNPVPEIGNLQSAIGNNAGDALKVVNNVFRDVPGLAVKGAAKDIMDTMAPVAKRYSGDIIALRAVEFDLNRTKKSFDKLYKALSKEKGEQHLPAIEKIEERMAKLTVARDELAPSLDVYLKEWESAAKGLAAKYPTTRIALAAEDTAEFTKYPWLKEMMTAEEKEAVVWLKNLHETYAIRMLETGHKAIEGPYVHHAWHPDWLETAAIERLKGFDIDFKGVPFSKFFHRAKYSRMMMPDINYTMQRYLMDAERRIQWSQFWGKGKKDSWYTLKRWVDHFGTKDHQIFWKKIADGAIPPAPTRANVIANIYSSFEVLRLLAFSPSVALKHYFKNVGTMSAMGIGNFASHLPEAIVTAVRGAKNTPEMKAIYRRLGAKSPKSKKKLFDEVADSFITQIHRMNMIADLDFEAMIPHRVGFWQTLTKKMQTFNRWGSIPVRAIESVDRHHTVVAAWEMAAKRGMTAQQAIYGIYSNILKLNFLSGAANPSWIRNPKIRAMVLFQNTVFKIMERRVMTAWRAGRDVKTVIGVIRHQDIPKTLKEMKEIGRYVVGAERELKQNMIFDALTASKDVFGTPAVTQAMREAIISGALLMGGGVVGMNLMPQVYHAPLLKAHAKEATLAVNPFIQAIFGTAGEREMAAEYGVEQDFLVTQFLKNWLRSTGYLPQTLNKVIRITKDDVPEIYKGSKWQYFFSVPATGEHY